MVLPSISGKILDDIALDLADASFLRYSRFAVSIISSLKGVSACSKNMSAVRSPRDAFMYQSFWGDRLASTAEACSKLMLCLLAIRWASLFAPSYQSLDVSLIDGSTMS